jgi:hypothetical protein
MYNSKKIIFNADAKEIYMEIPPGIFGRYIKSKNKNMIVCADFPNGYEQDYEPSKEKKYEAKIKLFENAHLIRVYYNFFKNEWNYATSNRSNAKYSIYETNKNKKILWNKTSFFDLFMKYSKNKIDYNKLSKFHTHFYSLFVPEIYITSSVKTPGIEYICKINNKTLKIDNFTDKIKRESNGILYVKENVSIIVRDSQYKMRSEMLGNIRNVYYIAIKNINNEEDFKRLFPYWSNAYNDMISNLNKMSVILLRFYRLIHMQNSPKKRKKMIEYLKKKRINLNFRKINNEELIKIVKKKNIVFDIFATAIHEYWSTNKKRLYDIDVFKIICKQPSHLISTIYRKSRI